MAPNRLNISNVFFIWLTADPLPLCVCFLLIFYYIVMTSLVDCSSSLDPGISLFLTLKFFVDHSGVLFFCHGLLSKSCAGVLWGRDIT
jgi:hypothetical protein